MNKCFITKLPSSVDNDNLPVLGQLKINWLKQDNLTNNDSRAIGFRTNDSITVKVSGAHFTDSTLTSNLGNTKTITSADGSVWLYISNDADAVLTIDNKYLLTALSFSYNQNWSLSRSANLDIEDIRYCTNLTNLDLAGVQVNGDISAVSNLVNLNNLNLYNTKISGDISALNKLINLVTLNLHNNSISGNIGILSNLINLTSLNLIDTQVSGDISALNKLTKLNTLSLNNTQVSGDISALSNLTNLTNVQLNSTNVSGDIASLANLTKLTYLSELKGISLTGDMSKIPANVNFISQRNRKINTNFTWTANGRQNATLLAIEGNIPFDTVSMDNMLIDQATCTVASSSNAGYERTIGVFGSRTSASDAAVATIQSKGITITGVTKQA